MSQGPQNPPRKKAEASLETLRRIFTAPEGEGSTLARIEREISENLLGFLGAHIVAGDMPPASLERDFSETRIPDDPRFVSEEAEFLLSKVVAQSVHTASPRFIGHMTSALPYFMMPLAKIMIALNQNLVKIETSKAFTPLERQVVGMLHRLVYERDEAFYRRATHDKNHSIGVFCSGGTVANITALWAARNRMLGPRGAFEGIQTEGLPAALRHYGLSDLAVLVSRRGHYSLKKAADLLGIGKKNLVAVATTADNKMDLDALRQDIARLRRANVGILAIVGIAGTTETGNVDPLDKLADIAHETGCHFHVDAAWGGPTLFSERYRSLLNGIALADSVTIDAHKQLYVPMGAGIVLFRDDMALDAIEQHAAYIIRRGSHDLGKHTLEGSRPGVAMLVHSALHIIGRKGFELLIDLGIGKAKQFAKMIQAQEDFELVTEPELNLLTYRYRPSCLTAALSSADGARLQAINQALNELTISIQKIQRARGKSFVSRTTIEPERYQRLATAVFRVVLANPLTTRQILAEILTEQREIAAELLAGDLGSRLRAAAESPLAFLGTNSKTTEEDTPLGEAYEDAYVGASKGKPS